MRKWFEVSGSLVALIALVVAAACTSPAEDPRTPPTSAEDGAPGFEFMVLINKQPRMSYEEYERYFFETHLPYVLAIPGLRGYKVNLRHPEDEDAPYDGISELWFDDRAAFDRAMASLETEATLADAEKFLMPPQIILVDERVMLAPGS